MLAVASKDSVRLDCYPLACSILNICACAIKSLVTCVRRNHDYCIIRDETLNCRSGRICPIVKINLAVLVKIKAIECADVLCAVW